MCTDRTI